MKKGERAGYSRSQPRKAVSRSEPGIRSVRQEGKKSPGNRRTRQESNGRQWTNSWQGQNVELYSESDWRWGQWRRNWHDRWNWDDDCNTTSSFTHDSDTRGCEYFQSGFCNWGASCYFSHDWTDMDHSSMPDGPEWSHEHFSTEPLVDDPQTSATAGLVFVLAAEAFEAFETPSSEMMTEDTGPMRVRVVGDLDELGYSEELEEWDPNLGVDLCWEGDVWRSFVIAVEPETLVHFSLVRLDQPESHPGLLQGWRRWEMHEQRHFTWSPRHSLRAPKVVWLESLEIGFANEILEVFLRREHCDGRSVTSWSIPRRVLPRRAVVTAPGRPFWQEPGTLRCFTFDGPGGVLKYCLYVPKLDDLSEASLVLFLHSMHGKLEGDNNLFFESDTPLRVLLDEDPRCPSSLRERCVLLVPQCPVDRERGDGAGIWLRKGWYEESRYDEKVEASLMALVEMVRAQYGLSRAPSLCGSSMGAYGALELTSRNPPLAKRRRQMRIVI
ncbi:Uncharacterized protein SCF082_LOCUS13447 [Durusdinium trenchii]|uniref:C3H1-type domain-containing protein n=1 Tax=Durusdinium trenchii TaxID=1381693 RepID=A0ABP0JRD5_9DINO